MPTLIMMHGMTGDASMMRPFAEKILPKVGRCWFLRRYNHPKQLHVVALRRL